MTLREKLLRFSDELAGYVYDITFKFPKHETYSLGDQLRRAVLSIGGNVAEGFGRDDVKDLKRFLRISYGSLCEVEYFMKFALKREYINNDEYKEFLNKKEELAKLLSSFSRKK